MQYGIPVVNLCSSLKLRNNRLTTGETFKLAYGSYFVHSYYVVPADPALTLGSTVYGLPFTSAVARDNIVAVQFHPEAAPGPLDALPFFERIAERCRSART